MLWTSGVQTLVSFVDYCYTTSLPFLSHVIKANFYWQKSSIQVHNYRYTKVVTYINAYLQQYISISMNCGLAWSVSRWCITVELQDSLAAGRKQKTLSIVAWGFRNLLNELMGFIHTQKVGDPFYFVIRCNLDLTYSHPSSQPLFCCSHGPVFLVLNWTFIWFPLSSHTQKRHW